MKDRPSFKVRELLLLMRVIIVSVALVAFRAGCRFRAHLMEHNIRRATD